MQPAQATPGRSPALLLPLLQCHCRGMQTAYLGLDSSQDNSQIFLTLKDSALSWFSLFGFFAKPQNKGRALPHHAVWGGRGL